MSDSIAAAFLPFSAALNLLDRLTGVLAEAANGGGVDITVDSTTSTPPACQSKNSTVH